MTPDDQTMMFGMTAADRLREEVSQLQAEVARLQAELAEAREPVLCQSCGGRML